MRTPVRAPAVLAALTLALGSVAVVAAPPATAAQATTISATTWAYIDSRDADRSYVDPAGDVPVGAWRDDRGPKHESKAYFTFDLTELRGATVTGGEAFVAETAANDCAKPRSTELWITDAATRPTWDEQPRERTELAGPSGWGACLAPRSEWDATPAAQAALASDSGMVTLVLRIADGRDDDVAYGRWFAPNLMLMLEYNFPPAPPTEPAVGDYPCTAGHRFVPSPPRLSARIDDRTLPGSFPGLVAARFAVWPVDRPEERWEPGTTSPGSSGAVHWIEMPDGALAHGVQYAWAVQGVDTDGAAGPWTDGCPFTADLVRPEHPPTVSSDVYPPDPESGGGQGVPGEFTFRPNGVDDVVGYRYGLFAPSTYVPAGPDGTATITFTPQATGPHVLAVVSVDRAGHTSDETDYRFYVRSLRPMTSCEPWDAELGVVRLCTFTSALGDAVSYTWAYDGGPEQTVPAGPDGTASVEVTPRSGSSRLSVRSTDAAGVVSPTGAFSFRLDNAPHLGCVGDVDAGELLACTVTPYAMSDVAAYEYRLGDGPAVTVEPDADGLGRFTLVTDRSGLSELGVVAITSGGLRSEVGWSWEHLPPPPIVTNAVYPENGLGGGVDVPGDFVVTPGRMVGIVEYEYRVDNGPSTTAAAGPDGRLVVPFTPDRAGWHTFEVFSRSSHDRTSEWRMYWFEVDG